MRTLFAIALLALPAVTQAFDFRGLEVGTVVQVKDVEAKIARPVMVDFPEYNAAVARLGDICGASPLGTVCNSHVQLGEAGTGDINVLLAPNGTLTRIVVSEIPSENFAQSAQALTNKFGKPDQVKHYVVQNAFGVKFEQIECIWRNSKGDTVRLSKYGATILNSSVIYMAGK